MAEPRPHVSGMIFYNEEGDEVGGLIYNGIPRDYNGIPRDSGYSAVGHLSFDQWKQNQVVALQYIDNGRTRRSGLRVWDRPTDVSVARQLDLMTVDATRSQTYGISRTTASGGDPDGARSRTPRSNVATYPPWAMASSSRCASVTWR